MLVRVSDPCANFKVSRHSDMSGRHLLRVPLA